MRGQKVKFVLVAKQLRRFLYSGKREYSLELQKLGAKSVESFKRSHFILFDNASLYSSDSILIDASVLRLP